MHFSIEKELAGFWNGFLRKRARIARVHWTHPVAFLLLSASLAWAQGVISTVAGNGTRGISGDGGAATSAAMNTPLGVAVDAQGNLYVSDSENHRVRKVTPGGIITTVAGTGVAGFSGDGGAGVNAGLFRPQGLAVDAAGNLYIADSGNGRVRKLSAGGTITTVAGNGSPGLSGDGGPATSAAIGTPTAVAVDRNGVLYISTDSGIRQVATSGVISTLLNRTSSFRGLALDASGNVYVADSSSQRVLKLTLFGTTSFAGNGTAGFSGDGGPAINASLNTPSGITFDSGGNLYITDTGNQRIRKVSSDGSMSTVAGTGTAGFSGDGGSPLSAVLNAPWGVALDAAGSLYFSDSQNDRVRRISPVGVCTYAISPTSQTLPPSGGSGTVTVTAAAGCAWTVVPNAAFILIVTGMSGSGNGTVSFSVAANPTTTTRTGTITVAGLTFTVTQAGANCTYAISPTGQNFALAGGSGTVAVTAGAGCPWTAVSNASFITVTSGSSGSGNGTVGYTVAASAGADRTGTITIAGITFTVNQSTVACSYTISPTSQLHSASSGSGSVAISTSSGCVWTVTSNDAWITTTVTNGSGPFTLTYSVATNTTGSSRTGTLTVAGQTFTVTQAASPVKPGGFITTVAGNGTAGYSGDGGAATAAMLRDPYSVALDSAGNLYIADSSNHRVRKVDPNGTITTVAGTGDPGFSGDGGPAASAMLNSPYGLSVDKSGNLYIADRANYRIRRVSPDGTINSIAGNGRSGFSGDGGLATNASVSDVYGMALDASGNLFIADRNNHRIRRITPGGVISTVAGNGIFGFSGDGGLATFASLAFPEGVALEASGNLYIADWNNNRVRRVSTSGIITTAAGNGAGTFAGDNGPAISASVSLPRGVAVDASGNLYIADGDNNRIRRVSTAGTITTVVGNGTATFSGDGDVATNASLRGPRAVALDPDGNLIIADSENLRIRMASQATCGYSLVPASLSFVSSGGTGGTEIRTQPGCLWTAVSNASWIVLTSTASGSGNGAVFFSFATNTGSSPRTGTITIGGQTFTISQDGLPATVGPTSFEPRLVRTLTPGFYIAEATLAPGALGGFWGMEVVASQGRSVGGFNLGGALHAAATNPGFGGFLLNAQQTVTLTLNAQISAGTLLTMRLVDPNRRPVGNPVSGLPPLRQTFNLAPGFYVVEVFSSGPAPFNFQLGLAADFFVGGVDVGGYIGPGSVGFGAFFLTDGQEVTISLFGRSTYGPPGAGNLILTLRDSNRNIIQTVSPP